MSTSAKTGLMAAFILSMRPKQWSKNLLVFMALFFTVDQAWDPTDVNTTLDLFAKSAAAFLLFSALSGVVYLVNDLMDQEEDGKHPRKRHRPIASGALPASAAIVGAILIGVPALAASYALEPIFGLIALVYLASMLLYSVGLKKLVADRRLHHQRGVRPAGGRGRRRHRLADIALALHLHRSGSGLRRALQATERACQRG